MTDYPTIVKEDERIPLSAFKEPDWSLAGLSERQVRGLLSIARCIVPDRRAHKDEQVQSGRAVEQG